MRASEFGVITEELLQTLRTPGRELRGFALTPRIRQPAFGGLGFCGFKVKWPVALRSTLGWLMRQGAEAQQKQIHVT